jgi:hypothetical protein
MFILSDLVDLMSPGDHGDYALHFIDFLPGRPSIRINHPKYFYQSELTTYRFYAMCSTLVVIGFLHRAVSPFHLPTEITVLLFFIPAFILISYLWWIRYVLACRKRFNMKASQVPIALPLCPQCKRQYSSSTVRCRYCSKELVLPHVQTAQM